LNNGFLAIEVPELVNDLKNKFGATELTVRPGIEVIVNFKESKLKTPDKEYVLKPVGTAAQELIVEGGLENWVKKRLE
jgi:homoaconitate hydratase